MLLYRPVGLPELKRIAAAGWRAFPHEAEEPAFRVTLHRAHAEALAKNWHTGDKDAGFAGFVTEFEVDDAYGRRFPVNHAAGLDDQEMLIAHEQLQNLCEHLAGPIRVLDAFYGEGFSEQLDAGTGLPREIASRPAESQAAEAQPPHA